MRDFDKELDAAPDALGPLRGVEGVPHPCGAEGL